MTAYNVKYSQKHCSMSIMQNMMAYNVKYITKNIITSGV